MKFSVIGCSPAWPNPGGAHSGYLFEHAAGRLLVDCGPGVLPRLRQREGWPRVDAIAITHFHLDHWGDLVPWVWGSMYRAAGVTIDDRPELWVHQGGRGVLEQFGERFGFRDMFDRVFTVREYMPEEPFMAGGVESCRCGCRTTRSRRTDSVSLPKVCRWRTRVTVGRASASRSSPVTRIFVCEATLAHGVDDGELRGHLSADEAILAAAESGTKRLLLTHRPAGSGCRPASSAPSTASRSSSRRAPVEAVSLIEGRPLVVDHPCGRTGRGTAAAPSENEERGLPAPLDCRFSQGSDRPNAVPTALNPRPRRCAACPGEALCTTH